MKHSIVAHGESMWNAVPANNGGCSPTWQWGDQLLVGYTQGKADFSGTSHQDKSGSPHISMLARSMDGGENWVNYKPGNYQGDPGKSFADAAPLIQPMDFCAAGFVMRIEGHGYHGNAGAHFFYSYDRGVNWQGPFSLGTLLSHGELAGKQFTARTAYIINSSHEGLFFFSARDENSKGISDSEKVFLAKTENGGLTFEFISWVVPQSDPYRAVMPSPARLSEKELVAAVRRRVGERCRIDMYGSKDAGNSWEFLSVVADTGHVSTNGNPPSLIALKDGRLCCAYGDRDGEFMAAKYSADDGHTWGKPQIINDDFKSVNGFADLGYPRLFQRTDGALTAVYFWCSPRRPQTHIVATVFSPPEIQTAKTDSKALWESRQRRMTDALVCGD